MTNTTRDIWIAVLTLLVGWCMGVCSCWLHCH